jgi:hypothetical protein
MGKEVQIYEVANTNLLYVITDSNLDATYYSKSNLEVEAINGYVVIRNEGTQVFRELPRDFVEPVESSVADLVEIIQGYINNIISEPSEELKALEDIIDITKESNNLLHLIERQTEVLNECLDQLRVCSKYLKKIYNPE